MNPLGKVSREQLKYSPNLDGQQLTPEIKIGHKTEVLAKEVLSNCTTPKPEPDKSLEKSLMIQKGIKVENEIPNKEVNIKDAPQVKDFNELEDFSFELNSFEFGDLETFDNLEKLDNLQESTTETIQINEDRSTQGKEEIAVVYHDVENIETHEDESHKNLSSVENRYNIADTRENIAALNIKNLYRFEGNLALNTASFAKMINEDDIGHDIHESSHAFNAKNYILPDFAAGKVYVSKSTNVPEGTQIQFKGHTLTLEYLTEEQEHNLAAEWETHMIANAPKHEEIKEDKEKSLYAENKSNYDTIPLNAKLTNGAEPSSWVKNHFFVPMTSFLRENAIIEKKNRNKSALKDEIQKIELKSEILSKGIKKNAIQTDYLKNSIVLTERINHNNIRSEHHFGIIPTLSRRS